MPFANSHPRRPSPAEHARPGHLPTSSQRHADADPARAGLDVEDPSANEPDDDDGDAARVPKRRVGRPRKADAPRYPVDEVDRLLVYGETVAHEETGLPTTRYPSVRDIAARFNVSHSVIAQYAARHNCTQRRAELETKARAKADAMLVKLRAERIAVSTDDAVAILDAFIVAFGNALKQGRVRTDNPADLNTALRLKAFLLGGADQRQEVLGGVSFEHIQAIHQAHTQERSAETDAARGVLTTPATAARAPERMRDGTEETTPDAAEETARL